MKMLAARDSLMFRGDEYLVNQALTLKRGSAGTCLADELERASGMGTCAVSFKVPGRTSGYTGTRPGDRNFH
jgi:hypothetical protein